MSDIEIPVGSIRKMDVAVWPVGVGDVVDLHGGRKHVDDNSIVERHYARTELFAPHKLTVRRIHREEITVHPNEITFVAFDSSNKMTLRVTLEKLSMNDVNILPGINDHNGMYPEFL